MTPHPLWNYIDRYLSGTGAVAETATFVTPQVESFQREAVCDDCEGSGWTYEICACFQCECSNEHGGEVPCPSCDGTGRANA